MSWTKTLNTKGQYFRKFIQSLKSNTGSVCRNNKNSCHKNSWSLLGTLCFWSHDFTFLSTIIEWEFLIGKKQRAGINIISDIEKLLKWLPVIYTRNKNQWMGWSNRPYSNSKKKLHWKCLLEKGNSGKFCRKSRICSTPNKNNNNNRFSTKCILMCVAAWQHCDAATLHYDTSNGN